MDRVYYLELAKARLERAKELLEDARGLFGRESYKSANNRAFYAMEKALRHCWRRWKWKFPHIMAD